MSGRAIVRVAAAILHRSDGKVLLAQRLPGTPYPGFWEFPGGKLEPGESAHDALLRELEEELGIVVTRAAPWLTQRYDYPHAHVELEFFRVFEWRGEPHGRDGQAIAWQQPAAIAVTPLLPANASVLRALVLPAVYAISMAEDLGEPEFLARARAALETGLKLIQLREKSFAPGRLRALTEKLLAISARYGARVLLNGDADTARELGCAGVHWSAARLLAARSRPDDMLCAASTHDAAELEQAATLGVDWVVLGPVRQTPTHPDARPLGWQRFAELAAGSPMPVYALGGLSAEDLDVAVAHGAHGVALRRAAWPAPPVRT
ncbi:MAG TPA: Nudix family hydrolase [Casimicrobiaceae bacterium]|nr:Nudix family hydrolase [Casimicrobiaceae bacterium]